MKRFNSVCQRRKKNSDCSNALLILRTVDIHFSQEKDDGLVLVTLFYSPPPLFFLKKKKRLKRN